MDTGLKLSMLFVLGVHEDKAGPIFELHSQPEMTDAKSSETQLEETISLKGNTMILFNSRAFEYSVTGATAKTLILFNQVPGPAQPPLRQGASFTD